MGNVTNVILNYFLLSAIIRETKQKREVKNMKYIFEDTEKTLCESDDIYDIREYIVENIPFELTMFDISDCHDYVIIHYVGYYLLIKK